jgi:hypothetical protein
LGCGVVHAASPGRSLRRIATDEDVIVLIDARQSLEKHDIAADVRRRSVSRAVNPAGAFIHRSNSRSVKFAYRFTD